MEIRPIRPILETTVKTMDRWAYFVSIPTALADDNDLWRFLESDVDVGDHSMDLKKDRCDHCGRWVKLQQLYTLYGIVDHHECESVAVCERCCDKHNAEHWLNWLDKRFGHDKLKPSKDDVDLVSAALGLKSSAWAQATVHLTEPQFNIAINGKKVNR
jgi:hypothetical protein